jgi:hypothetical protein
MKIAFSALNAEKGSICQTLKVTRTMPLQSLDLTTNIRFAAYEQNLIPTNVPSDACFLQNTRRRKATHSKKTFKMGIGSSAMLRFSLERKNFDGIFSPEASTPERQERIDRNIEDVD